MKKYISVLAVLLIVAFVSQVKADETTNFGSNIKLVSPYGVFANDGLIQVSDVFQDLEAGTSVTIRSHTSTISTATLVASGTTWLVSTGDLTDVINPRNIIIKADFATYIATASVTGTATITGRTAKHITETEALAITTNTTTGTKAWINLTSIAFSGFAISSNIGTTVGFAIGTGNKIGLTNAIVSTTTMKVIDSGATSTSFTLDNDSHTITFANTPNASLDYKVYYKANRK